MSAPINIEDGCGTKIKAKVTDWGQLVVAPLDFDESEFFQLAVINTAYNFYPPISGKRFVITGMRMKADRNVSNVTDAIVIVYEADDANDLTSTKILHEEVLIRGEGVTLLPVNILASAGAFINVKTTDVNIYVTIFGYYLAV